MPLHAVVVSSWYPVFKGDMVLRRVEGGYIRVECECDGLYLDADTPIVPVEEAAELVRHILKTRREELEEFESLAEKNLSQYVD